MLHYLNMLPIVILVANQDRRKYNMSSRKHVGSVFLLASLQSCELITPIGYVAAVHLLPLRSKTKSQFKAAKQEKLNSVY